MLWVAATLCSFGFHRVGEVVVPSDSGFDPAVHLAYEDIRINNQGFPQLLEVRIKASRTNPFRKGKGVSIYISRTGCPLCPVAVILSYTVKRGSSGRPLVHFEDSKYLARGSVLWQKSGRFCKQVLILPIMQAIASG